MPGRRKFLEIKIYNNMSEASESVGPLKTSSSDDASKKSSTPKITQGDLVQYSAQTKGVKQQNNDTVTSSNNTSSQSGASGNISPFPTSKHTNSINNNHKAAMMYGQLTPAGRSKTPTCEGRIKAPPVCSAPALQRVATQSSELADSKVCFSQAEAESCATKARLLWGSGNGQNSQGDLQECEVPLNIDGMGDYWKVNVESAAAAAEVKAYVSSSSTVVTNTSSSSSISVGGGVGRGGSVVGTTSSTISSVAGGLPTRTPVIKKDRPPLEVVRTDNEDSLVIHSEDERNQSSSASTAVVASAASSQLPLSREFTDNLVKCNSSRQGRSLQRWLVHSQTEELVRQVAGTIPITRDGRIVLVSARKKSEWILPKGGWDTDETREECAARETFEEGGLLGRLGPCLDPIDYERSKAKKKRLNKMLSEGGSEVPRPPISKRLKKEDGKSSYSPTGPELTDQAKTESKSTLGLSPAKENTKNYSYVRMLLFPLYVSEVKNDWPEKGRLRKLVDIDEAIQIMEQENRGYFKRGLEMIKERGLHQAFSLK